MARNPIAIPSSERNLVRDNGLAYHPSVRRRARIRLISHRTIVPSAMTIAMKRVTLTSLGIANR